MAAKSSPNQDKENKGLPVRDGIIPTNISSEMKESYLDYAMSVITSRALPDVRDGFKPVHRRILFAMQNAGLTATGKTRKSATVVGDVIGKYHPHGDSSVYEAMVKMAQEFSFRYPLVIGQGNFGSIDGDPPAAYRYTEAKMSKIAAEMLRDLEKDTVEWRPNYDNTKKEPVYLPAAAPNLLLNGTLGIAVGMATNIPPHNLGELVDASIHLLENPKASTEDLLEFVKGPDFPGGGFVFGSSDMKHAYTTGRGGVVTRGHAEITESKAGTYQIIITSLPYRVNKAELIISIANLVHEKKLEGVRGLRDESTRDIRIVIDLKTGAQPQKVLNFLYKHTDLETAFNFNMVGLLDGIPQTLSLKSLLEAFVLHRKDVITRRTRYELNKAEEREHILLGLTKALDHIDKIIKTIKASKDGETAKANLMKEFKFSERQAVAILEMRLQKLAGLERKQIEDELKEKQALIKELKGILGDTKKVAHIVTTELRDLKEKFGDERRTTVVKSGAKILSAEDMVEEKECMLVLTRGGYIKRTDPSEYRKQKRGGVGVIDLNTKEEDFVTHLISGSTHSDMLFFTDKGKAFQIKMYELPEGKRATKGKSVMNFLSLVDGEKITAVLPMPKAAKEAQGLSLFMVTKNGTAKKVSAESFKDVRRSGLIAIKLSTGDELLGAFLVKKGDELIFGTQKGQSIRFKESDIREMGRSAGGVRAVKLGKGDEVISGGVIKPESKSAEFLVVMENGYGKKTALKEYKVQKRGGSGIKTAKITPKTGKLITGQLITDAESEIVVISKKGQVIKTDIATIPSLGRQTQGVRIMKLRDGDSIASIVCF